MGQPPQECHFVREALVTDLSKSGQDAGLTDGFCFVDKRCRCVKHRLGRTLIQNASRLSHDTTQQYCVVPRDGMRVRLEGAESFQSEVGIALITCRNDQTAKQSAQILVCIMSPP